MKTWLSFPNSVRKLGIDLLNQQMWLLGCDLRRRDGNLLLKYGFEKFRPPENIKGSTCYCKYVGEHEWLMLWGFGLFLQNKNEKGIFLKRYEFTPRLMSFPASTWSIEQMPCSHAPHCVDECEQCKSLMSKACVWFAEYETWVLQNAGLEYRKDCLAGWILKTVCKPQEISCTWNQIGIACAGLHIRQMN